MKTKTLASTVLILIGIFLTLYFYYSNNDWGGMKTLFISLPITLSGIMLLFSTIGANLLFISILISAISIQSSVFAHFGQSTQVYVIGIEIILLMAGIVYGLAEGLSKLIKNKK